MLGIVIPAAAGIQLLPGLQTKLIDGGGGESGGRGEGVKMKAEMTVSRFVGIVSGFSLQAASFTLLLGNSRNPTNILRDEKTLLFCCKINECSECEF